MRAYRFIEYQHEPVMVDVPVPEPGPGQVLVKIGGAGACHSDLHIIDWPGDQSPVTPPFTLGHENAGWIEAVGAGVSGFAAGDPVAVYGPWGCGRCIRCRAGMENYCERQAQIHGMGGGLGLDGGMAEFMLVPSARHVVPLATLHPVDAAPLTDAGLTPYHAVKRSLPLLTPDETAVVIGVGGLGHMAVQILRAMSSSRIVAIDQDKDKLMLAQEVGADHVMLSGTGAAAEMADLTGGRGAGVVLDFVGADQTIAFGASIARPLGHLTVVGLAGGSFPFSFFGLPYECQMSTTYWGSVTELVEVIALAESHRVAAHVQRFGLDHAADAYAALRDGTLSGRAVIVPGA